MRRQLRTACLLAVLLGGPVAEAVRAEGRVSLDIQVVDRDGRPVPRAVVFLPTAGVATDSSSARAIVDQVDKQFVPHVSVVQAGTEVAFANSDIVAHHVYSFSGANRFELPLYDSDFQPTVRFDRPGVVVLGCNIHDGMLGYVIVVPSPYFGVSDERGSVVLQVPASQAESNDIGVWSARIDQQSLLPSAALSVRRSGDRMTVRLEEAIRSEPAPAQEGALLWDSY